MGAIWGWEPAGGERIKGEGDRDEYDPSTLCIYMKIE
jgi:hypothetical protein